MIISGQKSYCDRREAARARSEIVGTPHGHCRAPYDFHLKSVWIVLRAIAPLIHSRLSAVVRRSGWQIK